MVKASVSTEIAGPRGKVPSDANEFGFKKPPSVGVASVKRKLKANKQEVFCNMSQSGLETS